MILDIKTDAGPMKISAKMLKENMDITAPIVTRFFNSILQTGSFPKSWLRSYMVPIPKKGKHSDVKNYRGIAIQSILPKLLDRLLTEKLHHHISSIISDQQHGFVKSKSTTTNLFEKSLFIQEHLANDIQVDVIYFDLSKAFDTIGHSLIAKSLASTSIPKALYDTIMSFVLNRIYILKVDGRVTDHHFKTESAVPQGSHLGPTLFNIATTPIIIKCTDNSAAKLLSYADNSEIMNAIISSIDATSLQTAIDKYVKWTSENGFSINPPKCSHVTYIENKKIESIQDIT